MPSTLKSRILTAIMQALAAVPTPQNRIKTVRPNNDYTVHGTTGLPQSTLPIQCFTAIINPLNVC